MTQLPELLVISGPTATGKTALAVELARRLKTEVISADSMQVYRHLTIGTAKPKPEELQGVAYHLIDCIAPDYQYNLGDFVRDADQLIARIRAEGKLPIVCGGTCMYLKGLLYGVFGEASRDETVRAWLKERLQKEGLSTLYEELRRVDPAATHITPNDKQRILRALEVFYITGKPITALQQQHRGEPRYSYRMFVLSYPRAELYQRIEQRVDQMIEQGLIQEVQSYLRAGFARENPAIRALGYAEIIAYLEGKMPLEQAIAEMKKKTRHFAKRQLTWLRAFPAAEWVDASGRSTSELADDIMGRLTQFFCTKK
ncbi:MAG: tRNA dimethylallyltransferase [Candidatus Sumerlaea sp.]|uniref:tRNA dimethylallyltransferase n=1 Tax=Sumerlaea chitinivorans TaxID=2250252 RepID=A0A2Z4Y304_SUMC1|nr:tRNA dimethylallyltransferase [Candidatus Sumerlaea chitinivorans]GIX44612.1 MAG: tRNA dimethylallyltransferase [Candidatus Sumerlaea sp.]